MARHKEQLDCSKSNKAPAGKLISTSFLKLPLRLLVALCVVTALCSNVPSANCQPLFSKLAVFLRPRPPRPTTFPHASASQQYNNILMQHQQDQYNQQQFIHHQQQQQQQQQQQHQQQQQQNAQNFHFQGLPSNVYPTSSEHLQQLLMQQGQLGQGIPIVSMDPSQNSITIMTPTGPEQIMAPQNPNGNSGGGVFVAQPIQQNDNMAINTRNNGSSPNLMSTPMANDQSNQNVNINNNNNNNHLPHSGQGFTFLPNGYTYDGQNLIDGNILAGAASGHPSFAAGALFPGHYPNELQHPFQGLIFQPSNTETNQQMVRAPPPPQRQPPPPPPFPKNIKGPAIIAVPKPVHPQNPVLIPAPTYLAPLEGNIDHLVNHGSDQLAQQPIIIQSLHPLPNLAPAYGAPSHLLLSSPENAVTQQVPTAAPAFQSNKTRTRTPQKSKPDAAQPAKVSLVDLAPHFLEEIPQDPEQQKLHQNARLNILKMQHLESLQQLQQEQQQQPTARPTQIQLPESEANQNEQNEIDEKQSSSEYSLTTIVNLPTTTITGSFEYPDPPTPPNMESMNALKYPSRYEDSAEVIVKPGMVDSQYGQRMKDLQRASENLHNTIVNPDEKKKKPKTHGTTLGTSTTAAAASTMYRKVTTPTTRETTTVSRATLEDIMRETHMRAAKDSKSIFRPSPQIHSFEEPVSGVKSYITIMPPTSKDEKKKADEESERKQKSLFSLYEGKQAKHPAYEAGFKPVNHYLYAVGQAAIPSASTTSETLYFDLIREVSSKPPGTAWSEPDLTAFNEESKRELITTADGLAFTTTPNNGGYTTLTASSSTDSFEKAGWKVRDNGLSGADDGRRQLTTVASSDLVEDWRHPDTTADGSRNSIYFGNGKFGPPNCEKFQRFGFCPMNSGYPTDQVEKIASRCSALLSHLIAPLPKADVRYDVIVAKNGSLLKGTSPAPSGWNWKNFIGKPVCDTKEIKIVPGWAKNEQGEWLVILQTKAWKQEAQITLCTPQKTHYSCKGSKSSGNKNCAPIKIKCVQRFTAQRLAVLDPENTDRCPVLRSVFLPSACVCLYDNSASSSSEELAFSSKKSGGKKGKSSKKSSSKSKPSSRTERSEDDPAEVSHTSSEENTLDAAADSSKKTSDTPESLLGKQQRHQQHDEDGTSSTEEETSGTANERPHAEAMISSTHTPKSKTAAGAEEEEDLSEQSNQNEVEDDNEIGSNSTIAPTTTAEDDESSVTTTLKPELADDSSASEE